MIRQLFLKLLRKRECADLGMEAAICGLKNRGYSPRVVYDIGAADGGYKAMCHAELILMECQFFPFCDDMRSLDETIAYMSAREFIPHEFVDYIRRPLDGAMGQCDILFIRMNHRLIAHKKWR